MATLRSLQNLAIDSASNQRGSDRVSWFSKASSSCWQPLPLALRIMIFLKLDVVLLIIDFASSVSSRFGGASVGALTPSKERIFF